MMLSFQEQIVLIVYFLIFGMFLGAMYDILHYFLSKVKLKLIVSYLIELIYWIFLVIIACLYMIKISEGYLTIYAFLFFFIGVVIYSSLMRANFKKNLEMVVIYIRKVWKKIKKTILYLIYPKEVFIFLKKVMIKIMILFKKLFKRLNKEIKGDLNETPKETLNNTYSPSNNHS